LGCIDAELSIAIVDDDEMTSLNRQYRGRDYTTDVLAFSMTEGEFSDIEPDMLGDVVISASTADLIRRQNNVPLSAVLDLLLVHGILHLVGYDHERGGEQAQLMEKKTLEIMKLLGHRQTNLNWFLSNSAQALNRQ